MDNHTQYSGFAGVDLAKKVMQIHFVTGDGEITDKQVKRAEFLDFFRNRTKCLIGMEACGASQDWARKLEAMGHEVHLMSPKAVKPFVSGQKNDYNDAIGIYKAMFNGVRRVPVKSTEIRDLQTLRRIRSQVTKDKVKEINHVRGLLAEYGIVMGKSITAFNKGISSALESLKERGDVSPLVAEELQTTVESIKTKIERQKRLDREIEQLARGCKNYENFLKTPGVGPFTAAMLCVLLCDPIPGVGYKTASVVRGELFNLNEFPVDTHVNRVMLRLNIASKNDSPKDLEQKLVKLYSGDNMIHFHRQVITFGREICIAGKNCHCDKCQLPWCKNRRIVNN